MPTCARIIQQRGVAEGWGYSITDGDVKRILRRYKEHVTAWNSPRQTILNELALFDNALGFVQQSFPWNEIVYWFDTLPAVRAQPYEQVE